MTSLVDVSQADRDRMCAEVLLSAAKSLRCMLQDDLATALDYAAARLTAEQAKDAEIERLRAALEPFARYFELNDLAKRPDDDAIEVPVRDLRIAHYALRTEGKPS